MLASDLHIDSPYCRRDLLKRHLDKLDDNSIALLGGDTFDLMVGRNDPRRSYAYLQGLDDNVTDTALDVVERVLMPYRNHIAGRLF